ERAAVITISTISAIATPMIFRLIDSRSITRSLCFGSGADGQGRSSMVDSRILPRNGWFCTSIVFQALPEHLTSYYKLRSMGIFNACSSSGVNPPPSSFPRWNDASRRGVGTQKRDFFVSRPPTAGSSIPPPSSSSRGPVPRRRRGVGTQKRDFLHLEIVD